MIRIVDLTILATQTESDIVDGHRLRWLKSISIQPPASLSGVVTLQSSSRSERDNKGNPAHVFQAVQSEGADVVVTGDKVLIINELPFGSFRLQTTIAPIADEVYEVVGQDDPGF